MKTQVVSVLLISLMLLCSCKSRELRLMEQSGNRVRINTETESITAELITVSPEDFFVADRSYFWFEKGKVLSTQRGYSGKLLHGTYSAYDRVSKQLKTQGEYVYGLKEGKWMLWGADGHLSQSQHWKAGLQTGKTIIYDSLGLEKMRLKYRHGALVQQKESKIKNWLHRRVQSVFKFKGKKK